MSIAKESEDLNNNSLHKKIAKSVLLFFSSLGAEYCVLLLNKTVRWFSYQTHRMQLLFHYLKPHSTEWFDHYIDANYTWYKTESSHPWERGIMNALAIRPGAKVLELCSGDGFNAKYFYSEKAISLLGMDINKRAVSHSKKQHSSDKITFIEGNILSDIPDGPYDNVIWDASLYMFSDEELKEVVENCHSSMSNDGIMSGHASYDFDPAAPEKPASIARFEGILRRVFKNVKLNINTSKESG